MPTSSVQFALFKTLMLTPSGLVSSMPGVRCSVTTQGGLPEAGLSHPEARKRQVDALKSWRRLSALTAKAGAVLLERVASSSRLRKHVLDFPHVDRKEPKLCYSGDEGNLSRRPMPRRGCEDRCFQVGAFPWSPCCRAESTRTKTF
jgi:hypothetical protein